MLIFLFHENKNITHFNKNNVYNSYFSAPYIKEYFEINGIEVPSLEGTKRRIPFILNILEAFGIVDLSRSDFDIRKLPFEDCIFATENFNATCNIASVKNYYHTGALPSTEQIADLKMKFGTDFLTSNYKITP